MLRRIPRLLRFSLVVAVLLAVSASVYQTWTTGAAGLGTTQTAFGPVTQADRDLLIKVRQANLWEGPTSEQAVQMASSTEVRNTASKLAAEHAELDVETRRIADQLGIQLPANPSTTQQAWMNQIAAQTGSDYDRTFVQIVRGAHGNVLPVINDVRVSTRNDLVRQFAETADAFVTRHCQYLESTGLVDYAALPTTQATLMNVLTSGYGPSGLIAPILVFVAVLLGVIALLANLRKKKAQAAERVTVTKSRPAAPTVKASAESIPALTPVAALPVGGSSSSGYPADASMAGAYPMDAPMATSVIPSPRPGGAEPSVQWTMGGPGLRDTGPHPTIDAPGPYAPVSDSGAYRINSDLRPDMTGPVGPPIRDGYPIHDDNPGGYRPGYDSGGYPVGPGNGYPGGRDSGQFAQGQYRTVSETGSPRYGDSGPHRIAGTGTHRAVDSTGPRHSSVRR